MRKIFTLRASPGFVQTPLSLPRKIRSTDMLHCCAPQLYLID